MTEEWNSANKICGNCRYWKLDKWHEPHWNVTPRGNGGNMMDGSAADCRRRAPIGDNEWPQVARNEWCGDYHWRFTINDLLAASRAEAAHVES